MGLQITCDRCGQSESIALDAEADASQDEAWRQFNLGSQGGLVTLCVKCTSAFGRWVEEASALACSAPEEVQSKDSNVEGDTTT